MVHETDLEAREQEKKRFLGLAAGRSAVQGVAARLTPPARATLNTAWLPAKPCAGVLAESVRTPPANPVLPVVRSRRRDPLRRSLRRGDISFDMRNAEFGHRGNLCTFETMLAPPRWCQAPIPPGQISRVGTAANCFWKSWVTVFPVCREFGPTVPARGS